MTQVDSTAAKHRTAVTTLGPPEPLTIVDDVLSLAGVTGA
jgi:hypothetical protein